MLKPSKPPATILPRLSSLKRRPLPPRRKPLASVGRRGKRLRPGDDAARKACFARFGRYCKFCALGVKPELTHSVDAAMNPQWAHIYSRNGGAHLRHHKYGALPLCGSHHDWQESNKKESIPLMLACLTSAERDELEAARKARR